jgi:hypothetical protein
LVPTQPPDWHTGIYIAVWLVFAYLTAEVDRVFFGVLWIIYSILFMTGAIDELFYSFNCPLCGERITVKDKGRVHYCNQEND